MKYIGTMLSVFQRHSCICQVIIWTPEGSISYAPESLIVIFLPWYNCFVYVLNGNKMFWIEIELGNARFRASRQENRWLARQHHCSQLISTEWRICALVNWVIIGTCNGLSPVRRQAITWTNAGLISIGPLGTNFSKILIGILLFSFKKIHLKMPSVKMASFCPWERWVNVPGF